MGKITPSPAWFGTAPAKETRVLLSNFVCKDEINAYKCSTFLANILLPQWTRLKFTLSISI